MGRRRTPPNTEELLRTLLIVQLGLAGVGQREIRDIVGCDVNVVSRVLKRLKARRRRVGDE